MRSRLLSAGPTRSSYFEPRRMALADAQEGGIGHRVVLVGGIEDDGGGGRKVRRARERRRKQRARRRRCAESRGEENHGADIKPPRKDSSPGGRKQPAVEGDVIRAVEIEDRGLHHSLHGAEPTPLMGISKMGEMECVIGPVMDVPVGDGPVHRAPPPSPHNPPPPSRKRKRSSTVEIGTADYGESICVRLQHTSDDISGVQSEKHGNQQGKQDPHRDNCEDTPRAFIVKELRTRNIVIPDRSKESVPREHGRNSSPTEDAQLGDAASVQPRGKETPASTPSVAPPQGTKSLLENTTIPGELCSDMAEQVPDTEKEEVPVQSVRRSPRKRMKRTGEVSSYFSSSVVKHAGRVRKEKVKCRKMRAPAGVSVIPQPPLTAKTFGLIQEELESNAYYVIVAAVFLSKTRGAVAIPLLRQFLTDYPSPLELSQGNPETLTAFLRPLGLHHVRANRLIQMGKTWIEQPPTPGVGTKKYNYPAKDTHPFDFPCPLGGGSGQPRLGVEKDCVWEIAHLPGVGAYALDSWRIFCLDRFRQDAAGLREREEEEEEEEEHKEDGGPEWMRVVPKDKELRAYLRWRWAKEGWAGCEQLAE